MTAAFRTLAWLASLLALAACGQEEGPGQATAKAWFEDVADTAGLDFVHVRATKTRIWLPEIMSGGAAWIDYDGDGDEDLYLVQGGSVIPEDGPSPGNRMFRNDQGRFTDVTGLTGTDDSGYGMGAAAADYDRDGDIDLYVTNLGKNVLFRNEGDGTFRDVTTSSGVGHDGWGASAAWLDLDLDGDLDLYVTNYVNWSPAQELKCYSGSAEPDYCHPRHYKAPAADVLYRNDGGQFTDITEEAGIWTAVSYGLGVVPGDFNNDRWPDLYVANDGMPNQLWINRGDGSFEDQALLSGTAVNLSGATEAGMGVAAADIENDGDLDLLVTHLRGETNTLYLNHGGFFEDVTATTGLASMSVALTGFGVGFIDFDNDGRLDVYVGNGKVGRGHSAEAPFAEPNQLFQGTDAGRFEHITPDGGAIPVRIDNTRAVAFADYDQDGGVDAVLLNNGGRVRLLRNLTGSKNGWLTLALLETDGTEAIGARATVSNGAGRPQSRTVNRSSSYLSSNSSHLHFGLGGEVSATRVVVHWADGSETDYGSLPPRAAYSLSKGNPEPVRLYPTAR